MLFCSAAEGEALTQQLHEGTAVEAAALRTVCETKHMSYLLYEVHLAKAIKIVTILLLFFNGNVCSKRKYKVHIWDFWIYWIYWK